MKRREVRGRWCVYSLTSFSCADALNSMKPLTGNVDKARGILKGIDSLVPGLVLVRLRRIGLEVREQRYEEAEALYRESTTSAEDTETRNFYAWRYARFAAKVREIG